MSRTNATLNPGKLTFHEDENFISAGRIVLTAEYPSWSRKGVLHRVTVRDDGSPVGCTCTGQAVTGHCYHLASAEEVAREWWRRHFRALPSTDLVREDSFLAHHPALDAAQQLQSDALGDVVAERYAATHGRVETAVAS